MATCSKSCTQNAIPLLGETLELPTARRYHMLRDARIGGGAPEGSQARDGQDVGRWPGRSSRMKSNMLIVKHSSRAIVTFAAALALLLLSACGLEGTPLASLTTSAVAANEPSPAEQTVGYSYDAVQVAGYGKATGVPDVATLSLGVEVIDDTVAEARRRGGRVVARGEGGPYRKRDRRSRYRNQPFHKFVRTTTTVKRVGAR